jgi:hypothetical protein
MTAPVAHRLATLRVLVGGFTVVYLVLRLPHFWAILDLEARRWEPVGVLGIVDEPPSATATRALLVLTIALGAAFVLGWRYRAVAPAFAVALLLLLTVRNSWGQVWHTENLLVWHTAILACAPAAAVWSLDAARPRSGSVTLRVDTATWPITLMSAVTVATYVLAGVTKLREGGLDWLTGEALRNQVAFDNVRKAALGASSSPIAGPVLRHAWIFGPLALATLAIELGAPVAMLGGRWRTAWVLGAWSFHVGIAALMSIGFPYQLSGIAYASFFRVERLPTLLAEWGRQRPRARLRT